MLLFIIVIVIIAGLILESILEFILRLFGKSFSDIKNKAVAKKAFLAAGGTESNFLIWWASYKK